MKPPSGPTSKGRTMNTVSRLLAVVAASLFATVALAQAPASAPVAPGFVSKPVQVLPVTGDDTREAVLIEVSLARGASSPVHTHPGDCIGVIVDGTIEMKAEGQTPRLLKAGDSYSNARGVVHHFTNVGETPVRMYNTLVVDKGKPRTVVQPAAKP